MLGGLATLLVFFVARYIETSGQQKYLQRATRALTPGVQMSFARAQARFDTLAISFGTSAPIAELSRVKLEAGEVLLAWAPRITSPTEAGTLFKFDEQGRRVPVNPRPDYHPVMRAVPDARGSQLAGLDIASLPGALDTLIRARSQRGSAITPPARLPPALGIEGRASLVLTPVYDNNGGERGLLVCVVELEPFLRAHVDEWTLSGQWTIVWSDSPDRELPPPGWLPVMVSWGGVPLRFDVKPPDVYVFPIPVLVLLLGAALTAMLTLFAWRGAILKQFAHEYRTTQTAMLSREISGRLQAQAELEEKQAAFNVLFTHSSDLVLTLSAEGRIQLANPACCRALGFASQELQGLLLDGLLDTSERSRIGTLLKDLSSNPRTEKLELILRAKNGSRVLLEGELHAQRQEKDRVSIKALLRDVTERHRMEAALRRSQDSIAALVENTQDAIWSVDGQLRLQSFNTTFADLHLEGAGTAVQIGMEHLPLIDLENRGVWKQFYERALTGERLTVERVERLGGQPRTLLISMNPIVSAGSVSGVTVYRKDITEQKKLDNALRGLIEGGATATGTAFYILLAKHLAAALGVRWAFVGSIAPESKQVRILGQHGSPHSLTEFSIEGSAAEAALSKGSSHIAFGVRRLFPGDELLRAHAAEGYMAVPLKAGNSALLGVMGAFHDQPLNVTTDTQTVLRIFAMRASAEIQRSHAEEALAQARDAAVESSRLKAEFLANMSHEIRTPINGIIGMTEMLEGARLPAESQRYLANIRSCSDLLLTLIDDILDFSKIEAGKLVIETVDFNLPQIIGDAVSLFARAAQARGIRLEADIGNGVPVMMRGDPVRIRQIVNNLVSNAVKFTRSGSVRVRVGVLSQEVNAARLRFSVQDTGIGISDEAQARLFSPFVQADGSTTRRFGGSGLGLSICKRIVEMMGGEIGVRSIMGQGSEFWFELLMERSDRESGTTTQSFHFRPESRLMRVIEAVEPLALPRDKPVRILIVEDNPINQDVSKGLLARLNCETMLANNGQEALEILKNERFDLVLMDCQMPLMDGYEATAAIRQLETATGAQRSTIVAMTAHALPTERERCLACGMDDYVAKPITTEVLRKTLARWVPRAEVKPQPEAPPVDSADESDEVSLDLSRLRDAGGDNEGIRRLANMSITQLSARLDALKKAHESGNHKEVARVAHMCVGSCGACGMNRMAELWKTTEGFALAGDADGILRSHNELVAELKAVEQQINAYLSAQS